MFGRGEKSLLISQILYHKNSEIAKPVLTEENMLVIRQKSIPVYDKIEENVTPSLIEAYCGEKLKEIRAMVP